MKKPRLPYQYQCEQSRVAAAGWGFAEDRCCPRECLCAFVVVTADITEEPETIQSFLQLIFQSVLDGPVPRRAHIVQFSFDLVQRFFSPAAHKKLPLLPHKI